VLKVYSQVFLIFAALVGIALSLKWFILTLFYLSQLTEPIVNWGFVAKYVALLLVSLLGFVYSLKWFLKSRKEQREKMMKYREIKKS
jgi:hypothetical protein